MDAPRLLALLPEPLKSRAIDIIAEVLGALHDAQEPLSPVVIQRIRERLAACLALEQLEDADVAMAIQDVMEASGHNSSVEGAVQPLPPPLPCPQAFVPRPIPTGDPEALISYLFSLLRAHQHAASATEDGVSAVAPVDVEISRVMQRVLALPTQKPLARRVHATLRSMASEVACAEDSAGAARGQALIELIYNVILRAEGFTEERYETQEPLGPAACRMILRAFDQVGVNVREDPFPVADVDRCQRRPDCVVHDVADGGRPMLNGLGGADFEVVCNERTGRMYAFFKTLKKAIYGSVRLALVVNMDSTGSLVWNSNGGRKVAIKCIEKARIERMEKRVKERGKSKLNENPIKEIRCLSYITRRLSGQLSGPETIRGDPSRVIPVVDILEDEYFIFVVMPLMQREFFDVVDERSRAGAPFTGYEAWTYLSQLLGGLEVAHSLGLAHHDVSFENTMVDDEGKVVIIDWGMVVKVCITDDGAPVKVAPANEWPLVCGKLLYYCPEFILPGPNGELRSFDPLKLDIWSIGVMLFIMLTGVPPWSVQTGPTPQDSRFQWIIRGQLQELLTQWGKALPLSAIELLQAMLLENPDQRPTISEIRRFAWYQAEGRAT